jgi:tRNA-dependent cyclodipeptide synthase
MIDDQIINAVEASIYWKDLSGKYLGCNEYMEKMSGVNRNQIIGNTDFCLPWKDQANKIREVDQLVVTNRKKYQTEETATLFNGAVKIFLSSKKPLIGKNDEIIGVIGISIDITDYKRLEYQFEKTDKALNEYSSIKDRFLKNISHEARIPLGSVLSISELLNNNWDKFDDVSKRENVGLIFKEITRLSKFITDTFDTSKFLAKEIQLNLKKDNFSDFLKNIVKNHQKFIDNKNIRIEINHFDNYCFYFDQSLITRVIDNLIMNAIRYSPEEKRITISLYKSYLRNSEIPAMHCCINDEGIGVPVNEVESIFEPFVESSRTESKACGVGLGLSICKEIIEAHSGNIWVENNSLKPGVTFNFTIPTNLFLSSTDPNNNKISDNVSNVFKRDLATMPITLEKRPFALIGISPFNSYFSAEKILEIFEWVNRQYTEFAVFVPDQISKYTYEALGYKESRTHQKTRKQDNYTINKINNALLCFYQNYPDKGKISIHSISQLRKKQSYQDLYIKYSDLFNKDKGFRQNCLDMTEWVLLNTSKDKNVKIEESQKNIAVQYFLLELPIMTHSTNILELESCDFVYHTIPKFLKHLYYDKKLVSPTQNFLVLKG